MTTGLRCLTIERKAAGRSWSGEVSCFPASETFIRDQSDALRRWRPTYVGAVKMPSPLARETDIIVYPPGVTSRWEFLRLRLTGGSRSLRALLAELRPELVHAHFGGDGWLISRSVVQSGIPMVVTLHGRDVTAQPHASGPRGARYRRQPPYGLRPGGPHPGGLRRHPPKGDRAGGRSGEGAGTPHRRASAARAHTRYRRSGTSYSSAGSSRRRVSTTSSRPSARCLCPAPA